MLPETPLVVKNFFSLTELKIILECLEKEYGLKSENNQYLPYPFPAMDWRKLSKFSKKTENFLATFPLDLVSLIAERLALKFQPSQFSAIESLAENFQFNPFTIRVLKPGKVDIHHHVENQSVAQYSYFFQELAYHLQVYNQFSFVLMVQAPEQGGEIILFDEVWKGHHFVEQQRQALDDMDKAGVIAHKIKETIHLSAGDLLIFPAGTTWHKVAEVSGNIDRITLGGFIGKSLDKKDSYLFWS